MSQEDLHATFTYALRAGSIMARNGAPAANVTHTLLAVARTFGYPHATANVTMDQLTLSSISTDGGASTSLSQSVGASGFNLAAIHEVEHTTTMLIRGDLSIEDRLTRLTAIERVQPGHALPVRLAGWAAMAAGFALLLGATPVSILLAALTSLLIEAVGGVLSKAEVPVFFSHVTAGLLATVAARASRNCRRRARWVWPSLPCARGWRSTWGSSPSPRTMKRSPTSSWPCSWRSRSVRAWCLASILRARFSTTACNWGTPPRSAANASPGSPCTRGKPS